MFNRTAVVTGASGGIGSAVARALAADGWNVACGYNTNGKDAFLLVNELVKTGAFAFAEKCDVASPEQVEELFSHAFAHTKTVDLLVNCAGVALAKTADETTDSEFQNVFSVNMGGVFNCSRAAIPYFLKKKKGAIVNISSIWGVCGASCETVYSASKAAVIGFTKALAKELAPSGITVNCVAPGVIDTAMNANLSDEEKKALVQMTPTGRLGTPDDVAHAVVYLASAGFVTAQTLVVDGGFTA